MGDYTKIPEYLSEIEDYERRGARSSVFKGRILVVLGHVALRNGNLNDAVRYYDQGWRIVIERRTASTVPPLEKELKTFGNELLQIPCPREDKALVCEKLIDLWQSEVDEQVWSELISACELVVTELQR